MNKNPFTETLIVPFVRVIKRDVQVGKELKVGDYYDIEATDYTRVYRDKECLEAVMKLSAPALKLFTYLIYTIPEGAITIRLNEKDLMILMDCSDRSVNRMKRDLIGAAVLAKKEANVYWVNPRYFASKSRLTLFLANTLQVALIREKF